MLRDIAADADAAHATVTIASILHVTAARRAIAHAPDSRFDADPLRVYVTRHWYLHSYLDHLQTAMHARQPHTVTDAVEAPSRAHPHQPHHSPAAQRRRPVTDHLW